MLLWLVATTTLGARLKEGSSVSLWPMPISVALDSAACLTVFSSDFAFSTTSTSDVLKVSFRKRYGGGGFP